jgi:hypothetical protein
MRSGVQRQSLADWPTVCSKRRTQSSTGIILPARKWPDLLDESGI